MTQPFDSTEPRPGQDQPSDSQWERPYEQEPLEVEEEAPRRAASARFIVDAEIGSQAVLRDAMDPAHQSLADALRLSFRVLQLVILVLVVLFLASGFRTVGEGMSGVRTVWGNIVSADGQQALTPGPQFSLYPYPIGDFILFEAENRSVDVGNSFAPAPRGRTREQMLEQAQVTDQLIPGRDGSLLTKDGDLAHMELEARYIIDQPVEFVHQVNDDDGAGNANKLVQMALRRAAIHVTAGQSLQDLLDPNRVEDVRQQIQQGTQSVLDELRCGIQIASVQVQRVSAPLAIEKTLGDQQAAAVSASEAIVRANEEYERILDEVAGEKSPELLMLIDQYEDAMDRDDQDQSARTLAAINAIFEGTEITGDVSTIIQQAKAFQSQVERTLGLEYKRFQSLRPAFEQDPKLVVAQQWLDTLANVMTRSETEIIYVPDPLASVRIALTGLPEVQNNRRNNQLAREKQEADARNFDPHSRAQRVSDRTTGKAGRQLSTQDGKLRPSGGHR